MTPHETDQSESYACPESSSDLDKIVNTFIRLNDYLQELHMEDFDISVKERYIQEITEELERLIPCALVTTELLCSLQFLLKHYACSYTNLIFHHVLVTLEHPFRGYFCTTERTVLKFPNICFGHLESYFDLHYEVTNPEVSFNLIQKVWKYYPCIEFKLILLFCKILLENKHYNILDQLIINHEEYFLSVSKKKERDLEANEREYRTHLTLLLILLGNYHYATSKQMQKAKTVLMSIEHMISYYPHSASTHLNIHIGIYVVMKFTLRKIRLIPLLIKVLRPVLNRLDNACLNLEIISLSNSILVEHNCHKESKDFIKDNSHFILNLPFSLEGRKCYARQQLSILLLSLLHAYAMSDDLTNMNHVLNRLHKFRHSLLPSTNVECACFMGKKDCNDSIPFSILVFEHLTIKPTERSRYTHWELTLNDFRDKFTKEDLRSVWYHMIDAGEKYILYRKDLLEELILLIKQISAHNATGLYDIIKTLCDLEMQPEIQDMFIQGLTGSIHVKCNKQYSILSSLLLDINMNCRKGKFLTKLTKNVGQCLLLDVDTGNDVEKIIYRCFCIVRHENKVNDDKDFNIERYKKYFTFISMMEAEEEMLKLSDLRSFLLMLILLMISSGSQHKSAKLKKYLSLKYAYEDAILYLLWCSGDVEINPGPTPTKLEEKAIAVKMRNWTFDMCTITLKLLKNKALDSQLNGLWIEKPDNWQELNADKPFYNPRKKQKSKQLSVKTDKELLKCLLKCCDGKSITLPSNFQREIDAWNGNKVKLLLELYVTRKEINSIKKSIELLIMYRDTAELKQSLKNCNFSISFNHVGRSKDYSDIIRKFAVTFCRISKGLPILKKKDGIWKTPPHDWNPNNLYYDPCNTAKRHEQHLDQKLVDDLLSYCEKKSIPIPSELQLVVKAWKLKNKKEICKHYTIWSSMAVIQHSIKYLEIEGLLEKPDVQQSLKQIGVSLHCEKSSNQHNNDSTIYTDNKSKVSGLPMNSLSNNLRGTYSSSSLCSTRDSDIEFDCSQHPSEAKALTNSHSTKSVIKCSKPEFQNQPSTSSCTIYSKKAPCQDNRIDLQSIDERLEFSDSHTILPEISHEETHFQSSTSSCTTYSKRAPCRENSGDLQYTDERLDIPDSHKCVSEILCQKPDFQPSSSGCSSFIKRPECLNVRENVPSTERIQKRRRPSSEERSDKRPKLHSGNESQASTSSITRCYGGTIPSSHCDSDIADQCVNSTGYMEDSSDQSSNRITPPDNIQDTDSSKDDIFGLEDVPQYLEEIIDRYIIMSCDNLEENFGEDLEHIDRLFGEDLEHIDRLFGEDLEHIDRLLKLWETL